MPLFSQSQGNNNLAKQKLRLYQTNNFKNSVKQTLGNYENLIREKRQLQYMGGHKDK